MNPLFRWHQTGRLVRRLCFMTALTLGVGTAVFVGYTQQPRQLPVPLTSASGGGVHGSVFVRVREQMTTKPSESTVGRSLDLADFEVFLQNVVTGEASRPVKTNLSGRFRLPTQKAGTYELRWKEQA